jgi:hypothetical protein
MSLEEAILDRVRHLPQAKQEEVLRFADGPRQVAGYAGQWVAVEGDRPISAGVDGLKVFAAAKAEGIEIPFVVRIDPEDSLPFVPGW